MQAGLALQLTDDLAGLKAVGLILYIRALVQAASVHVICADQESCRHRHF